jgi:hypothetical protein
MGKKTGKKKQTTKLRIDLAPPIVAKERSLILLPM